MQRFGGVGWGGEYCVCNIEKENPRENRGQLPSSLVAVFLLDSGDWRWGNRNIFFVCAFLFQMASFSWSKPEYVICQTIGNFFLSAIPNALGFVLILLGFWNGDYWSCSHMSGGFCLIFLKDTSSANIGATLWEDVSQITLWFGSNNVFHLISKVKKHEGRVYILKSIELY